MVIAEDDDTYQPQPPPKHIQEGSCPRWRSKQQPEKVLFCGWRRGDPLWSPNPGNIGKELAWTHQSQA